MIKLSEEAMKQLNKLKVKVDFLTPSGALSELDEDTALYDLWYEINNHGNRTHKQYLLIDELYGKHQHFEEEKPKKYIVRATDDSDQSWYLSRNDYGIMDMVPAFMIATTFDTKEEAEKWTNPLTEVVEVE
ncbi:hypothetical protein JOC36_000827 [Weissella uvarum]|uniref:hypothetical protein n=1 Tax=Lactobacillaceae TaxID=33958 RepID=UPI0019610CBA|nr:MULTISPECIES: hypothetical protein [Lactobacillaceae]MBM7617278.1 hypothetical protein [Weissella uvarum]MCM0595218.1 hypothetical protein [Weissella uvarum]